MRHLNQLLLLVRVMHPLNTGQGGLAVLVGQVAGHLQSLRLPHQLERALRVTLVEIGINQHSLLCMITPAVRTGGG